MQGVYVIYVFRVAFARGVRPCVAISEGSNLSALFLYIVALAQCRPHKHTVADRSQTPVRALLPLRLTPAVD